MSLNVTLYVFDVTTVICCTAMLPALAWSLDTPSGAVLWMSVISCALPLAATPLSAVEESEYDEANWNWVADWVVIVNVPLKAVLVSPEIVTSAPTVKLFAAVMVATVPLPATFVMVAAGCKDAFSSQPHCSPLTV